MERRREQQGPGAPSSPKCAALVAGGGVA